MNSSKTEWVLVKSRTPTTTLLHGSYAVILTGDLESNPHLWELVDGPFSGSATEWVRLLEIRDRLRLAHEVMES
jgi:hypothetical protein